MENGKVNAVHEVLVGRRSPEIIRIELELAEERGLVDVRKQVNVKGAARIDAGRQLFVRIVIPVQSQDELLEVVDALGASGGLAHFLHGRHQQGYQDRD